MVQILSNYVDTLLLMDKKFLPLFSSIQSYQKYQVDEVVNLSSIQGNLKKHNE